MKGTVFIKIAFPSPREQKGDVALTGGTIRPIGKPLGGRALLEEVLWCHRNDKDLNF